jgi:hypothetical protein
MTDACQSSRVTAALKIPSPGEFPDTPTLETCKRLVARINHSSALCQQLINNQELEI